MMKNNTKHHRKGKIVYEKKIYLNDVDKYSNRIVAPHI